MMSPLRRAAPVLIARLVGLSALSAQATFLAVLATSLHAQNPATYFPPPGQWQSKSPRGAWPGLRRLHLAVEYAQSHGSTWDFDKDQIRTFGTPLGPLPKQRAATNGIILRHGYIVAQFGDTKASDPVYSVAKSFLSTVASLDHGPWGTRQLVSEQWLKDAVEPSEHGPDYDYLWWLNTKRKQWPNGPASSFAALGNGSNAIWIDPDHDIVFVWHWYENQAMDGMIQRIVAAVTGP